MGLRGAWALALDVGGGFVKHKVMTLSAALSFYALLSLPPAMVLAIWIAGLFLDRPVAIQELHSQLQGQLDSNAAEALLDTVRNVARYSHSRWSFAVGVVVLGLAATTIFVQLQNSLNTIWEVGARPPVAAWSFLRQRLLSFLMMLALGVLLLVSVLGSGVLTFVQQQLSPTPWDARPWQYLHLLASMALTAAMFEAIYVLLPDVRLPWRAAWPGAIAAAVLFVMGHWILGTYLARMLSPSAFGTAGAIIVVLLWVYYSGIIFLGGAELVRALAARRGAPPAPGRLHERIGNQ